MHQTFQDLSKRLDKLFKNFETFLSDPENEYTRSNVLFGLTEVSNKQQYSFELKVGSRQFLVKGDIKLTPPSMVYLQTFAIIPNLDLYPNQKLRHIPQLDIALSAHGNRFVKRIDIPNSFLNDPTIIREFGPQYTEQLWCIIQNFEKTEVPEMEELR